MGDHTSPRGGNDPVNELSPPADPDLLRRLFMVHEDLRALIAAMDPPLPACVPRGFPPAGLGACAKAIAALVQALQLDPAALRTAYGELVAFNAEWQEQASRIEPDPRDARMAVVNSERISAWRARTMARLERTLSTLRELIILVASPEPPEGLQ